MSLSGGRMVSAQGRVPYAPVKRVRNPARANAHEMTLVYVENIRCMYDITMLPVYFEYEWNYIINAV